MTSDLDAARAELRALLRRLLDRFVAGAAPPSPRSAAGDYDRQLWQLLTGQVGVAGLAVPERFGGSGGGYLECHLVLEELGRAAVASPFLASSVLATQAVLLTGDEELAAELLPELAAGTRTATVVLGHGTTMRATLDDGGWTVDGQARPVLDGARADLLLLVAEARSGPGLFLLDTAHPGLRRDLLPTLDQSLHLAEVRCQAVPARRLGRLTPDRPAGLADLPDLAHLAAIAITAEQVGGAARCLELTVEHAKHRVQFGRPIGGFQAVQHRLADLLVLVESARSASQAAALAWATDPGQAPWPASLAKSYCSEAYRAVTAETIQLHGGLGFTWEHPAHRYFKRAHATSMLFGDPADHRRRLADRLGLTGGPSLL